MALIRGLLTTHVEHQQTGVVLGIGHAQGRGESRYLGRGNVVPVSVYAEVSPNSTCLEYIGLQDIEQEQEEDHR